jgi:hypothetical protein
MFKLTHAQSEQINSSVYTHDYEAEAVAVYESTGADGTDAFTDRFEQETGIAQRADSTDIGGLIVYYRGRELLAFYDYERFVGTVF